MSPAKVKQMSLALSPGCRKSKGAALWAWARVDVPGSVMATDNSHGITRKNDFTDMGVSDGRDSAKVRLTFRSVHEILYAPSEVTPKGGGSHRLREVAFLVEAGGCADCASSCATTRFGATARKLSSIQSLKSSIGALRVVSMVAVTHPCFPNP